MTQKEYRQKQRENDKRRNIEKYLIADTLEVRRSVIKEYKCDSFLFVVKVPHAKYGQLIKLSKTIVLAYAGTLLKLSIVNSGEQKRDEGGKPCYRFNTDALRSFLNDFTDCGKLDFRGLTWARWKKAVQPEALRHNAGCWAEAAVCEGKGWKQIGEKDNLSHTHHTDALTAEGEQVEIKLEDGYFTSQFWTALHEWKNNNDNDGEED